MPEVFSKEGYDIDRLENIIVIALQEFLVIEPASVIDTPLKETVIHFPLDLHIESVSRVSNAHQIKEGLLRSGIVHGLLPVVVTQDGFPRDAGFSFFDESFSLF